MGGVCTMQGFGQRDSRRAFCYVSEIHQRKRQLSINKVDGVILTAPCRMTPVPICCGQYNTSFGRIGRRTTGASRRLTTIAGAAYDIYIWVRCYRDKAYAASPTTGGSDYIQSSTPTGCAGFRAVWRSSACVYQS